MFCASDEVLMLLEFIGASQSTAKKGREAALVCRNISAVMQIVEGIFPKMELGEAA